LTDIVAGNPGDLMVVAEVTAGAAWFAGSRIDQASGDPFTLAAVVPDPSLLHLADLAGNYFGVWGQGSFDEVSGDAEMTITVDEGAGTASVTLDFDGPMLHGLDPGPLTVTGPLGPGSGHLTGSSTDFGTVTLTVDAHGKLEWTATEVPDPEVEHIISKGFITQEQMIASFNVELTGSLGNIWGGMALVRDLQP